MNTCGNGMVDPGEPCDPSSPGGAFSCAPGETCSEICTCLPPTTTTLEPTDHHDDVVDHQHDAS